MGLAVVAWIAAIVGVVSFRTAFAVFFCWPVALFAAFSPQIAMYGLVGGLGVALAAGVVYLLRLTRQIRQIEDSGTSRLRSVAQGYVEIHGKAAPVSRLTECPACHLDCVWWSVDTVDGKRHSGEVPFMVTDGPDFCIVDPKGAAWVIPETRCLGMGTGYRPGGRHVVAGDLLHVLGELVTDRSGQGPDPARVRAGAQASAVAGQRMQQALATPAGMASADTDRDGKLSLAERQAFAADIKQQVAAEHGLANWQSEVHRVGRPRDRRPFVIATESQVVALRRMRRRLAFGGAGVLAIAVALGAVLLIL